MNRFIGGLALALILPACSQETAAPAESEAEAVVGSDFSDARNESPAERQSDDAARPANDAADNDAAEEPSAFERSIPAAIRGKWRLTDGPAPTAARCDETADGNIGKVLLVRADGFSIFETGGRLEAVADRSPGMIRATYDTTYADEPTTGDITFRVDPVAKTLTMIDNDAPDEPFGTRVYKRCP